METINWKIEGMSCSTCALTINKYLEKKGLKNIKVSLASGDVSFDSSGGFDQQSLQKGIQDLGYTVVKEAAPGSAPVKPLLNKHLRYFLFCLPFTLLLLLHMVTMYPGWMSSSNSWLTRLIDPLVRPWSQFVLCLPVFIAGMRFFGRSAFKSLLNGLPNMNVLIAIGAIAAFVYSLTGTLLGLGHDYLFYETTASIITIVFLGYYLEDASVQATQRSLNSLAATRKTVANMIAFDDQHREVLFPVESDQLRSGDLILIRSGEEVPADARILWGEAGVDESILTGESLPIDKKGKDTLIGGSLLVSGTVKAQVTAAAGDSILAGIVRMVRQAQGEKPPIQQLADRISAIFVPVVLGLAVLTFVGNYLYWHEAAPSLMRSIAVLVIACPCAMGLATPAAIAVGLGRGARKGILFRNARHLEAFKDIRQVVLDKTGTLTTGEFSISQWQVNADAGLTPEIFKEIAFSLEKYSTHPIAKSITREWKPVAGGAGGADGAASRTGGAASGPAAKPALRWQKIEEVKGLGMRGETKEGDIYWAGSYRVAANLTSDATHNVYIVCNHRLLGYIDVKDTLRPEAAGVISWLHSKGIHTILLSGDRKQACQEIAATLGIQEVLAEQTPEQKLEQVTRLNNEMPTAMVGDGINDAPALARASIGISMSDASQLAVQTADVVLMNNGLQQLPAALGLGRQTFSTIKGNLFWAFFYNIIAIPVAAFGLLTPALAALVMGLSDVVLAANSLRLYVKKVA
ncbi:MAG TPA: cation-translocating P-type ATPase [Puia sp.]|jgi:Cu+-exporting ATPase|nr:cation-translocating P-type ATPase [Puia sp.]